MFIIFHICSWRMVRCLWCIDQLLMFCVLLQIMNLCMRAISMPKCCETCSECDRTNRHRRENHAVKSRKKQRHHGVGKKVDCPQARWDFGVVFYMDFPLPESFQKGRKKMFCPQSHRFINCIAWEFDARLIWYPKISSRKSQSSQTSIEDSQTSIGCLETIHATKKLMARQLKKSSNEPNWSCQALRSLGRVKIPMS